MIRSLRGVFPVLVFCMTLWGCGTANVQHRMSRDVVPPGQVVPQETPPEREEPREAPVDRELEEEEEPDLAGVPGRVSPEHARAERGIAEESGDLDWKDFEMASMAQEETPQEAPGYVEGQARELPHQEEGRDGRQPRTPERRTARAPDFGWTERVVTDDELERLALKDPELTVVASWNILARLNTIAHYYIPDAIRHKIPLKVPNDFSAYKNWSPLPDYIHDLAEMEKFIIIVKDHPFLGWYEKGRRMGDTQICVGKKFDWTRAGVYSVKEKDAKHVSRSYPNYWGQPSPMPWALRIYETVWIHAGDVTEGYCSHGCINLPIKTAEWLFNWAEQGTTVLVVNSVDDLESVLARNRANCLLFADACPWKKHPADEKNVKGFSGTVRFL
ncbi:MAG: L,D-transpeptidase [Syntrophobacteraceae bacterium]|nr:L,D-transpeptidase [Desulfobacteraceae bacterium]